MIRQAHTYLAGAVSGSALVAAAVVAFVLLVSFQALEDWPLAGIVGGGGESAVSDNRPAPGAAGTSGPVVGGAGPGASAGAAARGTDGTGNGRTVLAQQGAQPGGVTTSPFSGSPAPAGNAPGSSPAGGGNTASTPSASPSSGATGEAGSPAAKGGGSSESGSGQSTSAAVTGAVNETVSGVDKGLGDPLGEAGVTEATEKVVNGVAGPESALGETVDKTVEAVGGLIGGGGR
jgi:hypothetical protein